MPAGTNLTRRRRLGRISAGLAGCAAAAGLSVMLGCAARVTPTNVVRDRIEYGTSLSESWKRQTLMNCVRLRYADAPAFLEVSSVINTYSEAGSVNGGAEVYESPDPSGLVLGGQRSWSNSPTITYQPMTGDKFTRNLLTPVPPVALMQLVQAGWPVEIIFPAALRAINGLKNQTGHVPADPRFTEVVAALGRVQRAGTTGLRLSSEEGGEAVVMVIGRAEGQADLPDSLTVRERLRLAPDLQEFAIVFGAVPRSSGEVAMLTRSMMEIMLEVAVGIDVPQEHVEETRVLLGTLPSDPNWAPLVRIHSGKEPPADAYAAVPYGGYWFWIDSRDIAAKRTFTFLMILFSLSESGQPSAAPTLTIGAGR